MGKFAALETRALELVHRRQESVSYVHQDASSLPVSATLMFAVSVKRAILVSPEMDVGVTALGLALHGSAQLSPVFQAQACQDSRVEIL